MKNPSLKTWSNWLFAVPIVAVVALAKLGFIDPVIAFLSRPELTLEVGSLQFNAYQTIKSISLIIILIWAVQLINRLSQRYVRKMTRITPSNRVILGKVLQIVVYFFAFLVALDLLNIDLTALAVFSGAVGIGLGFGLQKIASNFISGLILVAEKSVKVGDMVELTPEITGFIKYTGARHTLLETLDGKEVMIPNEDFITNQVVNWTHSNKQGRIAATIGVSYGSDIQKAHDLIIEAAKEHPQCSKDPEPRCWLTEFGDSSVNFLLYFWVDDIITGRYRPRSEVLFSVWNKFKENNIEIPFPQRDLHVKGPIEVKQSV